MNDVKPLRLFSFTRDDKDTGCNRAGYLSREWGGTGLVPIDISWDLVYGNILHKHLNLLALNGKLDTLAVRSEVFTEAFKAFKKVDVAKDWATQAQGLLATFQSEVWPLWMQEYEVFEPESWIEYEVEPGFVYRARRDLLLVSKVGEKHFSYREYKSTSTTKPEFFAAFSKDLQVHTGMLVEKYVHGREVRDAVVQTFYKGSKDKKLKTQRHLYSHGYVNREYSMLPEYSVERKWAKGWELFSTFDEFPDLGQWISYVKNKTPEHVSEQLGRTGPIFPREDIVQKYFKQKMFRQRKIQEGVELLTKVTSVDQIDPILDEFWPQNFTKCEPKWGGFHCEFKDICWNPWVGLDPLGSGLFERYDGGLEEHNA